MARLMNLLAFALLALAAASQQAKAEGFRFLSLGDWGDADNFIGSGLARFFDEEAQGAPLGLLLGDNFYNLGVQSVDDPQWQKVYLNGLKGKNVDKMKFVVTSGNHDYYGNITAQVEYTKKDPTKRWLFPSLYHSRYFESGGVSIFVLAIDTWRLNGGDALLGCNPRTGERWIKSREAVREAVQLGSLTPKMADRLEMSLPYYPNKVGSVDEQQYEWIKRTLRSKSAVEADWRIVIGHFPIHSASLFEHGDTASLVKRLDPILRSLNVDAYFSGHDHILQLTKRHGNLHYYGSGAGGRRHPRVNPLYRGLLGHSTGAFGFMKHKATKKTLSTTFVISQGPGLGTEKSYAFEYVQTKPEKPSVYEEETLVATK